MVDNRVALKVIVASGILTGSSREFMHTVRK
jgi:hypothetical protein